MANLPRQSRWPMREASGVTRPGSSDVAREGGSTSRRWRADDRFRSATVARAGGLDEACKATGVFCIVVGALPIVSRALPGLGERSPMFLPCSALQWKRSVVLLERSRFLHPRSAADRPAS